MRIAFSLIALCLAGLALAQDKPIDKPSVDKPPVEKSGDAVWKWVDRDGVTHYSDQPGPGAVKVDLRIQTYEPTPAQPARPTTSSRTTRTVSYRSVTITSPSPAETIHGPEASVTLTAQTEPELQSGHRLRFELDGQAQAEPTNATTVVVRNLERGEHRATATIVGPDGENLLQSRAVTFFVQQSSTLSPNRPPPPSGGGGGAPPQPQPKRP